ncbi:MAG: Fibronectin type III domain protein [bacterium ADurb.Bin212]|nr:MAG: Fibronectin type III domain protein [bacterium ADurb.Bin212]
MAADWYDSQYMYRQKYTIDNSSGMSAINDYQIRVDEGMTANYPFNDASGTNAYDISGEDQVAKLYPATSGGTGPVWTTGKFDGGLSFDGSEDYLTLGKQVMYALTNFSISVWVKTNQSAAGTNRDQDPAILGLRQTGSDYNEFALTNYNGNLAWYDEFGAEANTYNSNTSISDDDWHHVVVNRSGTTLSFYLDGELLGNDTTGSDIVGRSDLAWTTDSYVLEAGRANITGGLYFAGQMDELRIYGRTLSDNEVGTLFASNTASRLGSLYSHAQGDGDDVRFTATDGTTLLDYWVEKYLPESQNAVFWVKAPLVQANSVIDIYMYYGNADATSASNGDNTFVFFDDFSGASIDTSKWSIEGAGHTVSGGIYSSPDAWSDPRNNITSVDTFSNNIQIDIRWKNNTQYANNGQVLKYGTGNTFYGLNLHEGEMYALSLTDPNILAGRAAGYEPNRYGTATLIVKNGGGALACGAYYRRCISDNQRNYNDKNIMIMGWNTTLYVDWIHARNYVAGAPSVALISGSEELGDLAPPVFSEVFNAYDAPVKTNTLSSGQWHKYAQPYFEWTDASDDKSGVKGYYVYFGNNPEADPTIDGAFQSETNYLSSISLSPGESYYLRIVAEDNMNNQTEPITKFEYLFDNVAPDPPEYINISPIGCSTANTFNFDWPLVIDADSQLQGYQYRKGSMGEILDVGTENLAVTAYQEGDNILYVRSQDNAGNLSSWQTAIYCSTATVHVVDGPTVISGPSSITVGWVSSKMTTGYVKVYEGNTYISEQGLTTYSLSHSVKVIGLEPEKEYRYQITWTDQSGNLGETEWFSTHTDSAPQINNLEADILSPTQVNVSWDSTIEAVFSIEYGFTDYDSKINLNNPLIASSNKISDLSPGKEYRLRINAVSSDGTRFYSGTTFQMPPLPEISDVGYESINDRSDSTIELSWRSNVPTTSSVFYGLSGQNKTEISKSDMSLEHTLLIESLVENSIYDYYVTGMDGYGNIAKSNNLTFETDFDTRPPVISQITIETSNVGLDKQDKAQIAVSWRTDEPTTSQVEYGEGIAGSEYTNKTTEDKALTTNHLVIIPDLTPGKPYHIRVISTDKGNNTTLSKDHTVIPGDVPRSALQIILNTFTRLFGWLGLN